jgi:hypothetical protein
MSMEDYTQEKSIGEFIAFVGRFGWEADNLTTDTVTIFKKGVSVMASAEWHENDFSLRGSSRRITLRAVSPFDEQMAHGYCVTPWDFDPVDVEGYLNAQESRDMARVKRSA